MSLQVFFDAYMEAVEFTDCNSDYPEMQAADGYSEQAMNKAKADCYAFYDANSNLFADNASQAGHDFWLTRNGHGTGFWDRPEVYDSEIIENASQVLTDAAEKFGTVDAYVGDDNMIHFS